MALMIDAEKEKSRRTTCPESKGAALAGSNLLGCVRNCHQVMGLSRALRKPTLSSIVDLVVIPARAAS